MKEVHIKNLHIGTGQPKICVPIVARNKEQVMEYLPKLNRPEVDLIEWRIDHMDNSIPSEELVEIAKTIRTSLPNIPLLITFRTANEGGERAIALEEYFELYLKFAKSKAADLIDLEVFITDDSNQISTFAKKIQALGCYVIFSNHDFHKTPSKEEIVTRLTKMQELGCDIAKIAVMPTNAKDVLTLLAATEEMQCNHSSTPVVTMSMGQLGAISRIAGSTFGSSITFGALEQASAPGQISLAELKQFLTTLER